MTFPCHHIPPFFSKLILLFAGSLVAASTHGFTDSSRNPLLATQAASNATTKMIRAANMIYPNVLRGQEQISAAYVQEFAERKRGYIMRMHAKGKKLLPQAAKIFKQYQLPPELTLLLPLESAFQPRATSSAGAFGYWQFMDDVAKEFGLRYVPHYTLAERNRMRKQNSKQADSLFHTISKATDDRAHFSKSTHAAARYLKDRWRNLNGDLLLVVASYNWGVGHVWQAMAESGKSNPGFWDIHDKLPRETQLYVKSFIAMNVIFSNYDAFLRQDMRFVDEEIEIPVEEIFSDASEVARPTRLEK